MKRDGERIAKEAAAVEVWRRQHAQPAAKRPVENAYAGAHYRAEHGAARWVWLIVVAMCLLLAYGYAKAQTVGVNLVTAHDRGGYERNTPGVYVRLASGYGGGVLSNSLGRISWHVERSFESTPVAGVLFAITVGGITGYPFAPVSPLLTLSAAAPVSERLAHRLLYVPRKPDEPRGAQALNYALEFKL